MHNLTAMAKRFRWLLVVCLTIFINLTAIPSHSVPPLSADGSPAQSASVHPKLTAFGHPPISHSPKPDPATRARIIETYEKLPISFEENQGQVDSQVKFLSRSPGYNLFLTSTEAVLAFQETPVHAMADNRKSVPLKPVAQPVRNSVVRMKWMGANPKAQVIGVEQLPGSSNYFIRKDPQNWHTNIPGYARVKYTDIYPGVSLIYYGNQHQLEYDFQLAPGADPQVIKLAFDGVERCFLDQEGNLRVTTASGELCQHKPYIYQMTEQGKQEIRGRFVIRGKNTIGFLIGDYDKSKTLVIDPALSYSTYLGGNLDGRHTKIRR